MRIMLKTKAKEVDITRTVTNYIFLRLGLKLAVSLVKWINLAPKINVLASKTSLFIQQ